MQPQRRPFIELFVLIASVLLLLWGTAWILALVEARTEIDPQQFTIVDVLWLVIATIIIFAAISNGISLGLFKRVSDALKALWFRFQSGSLNSSTAVPTTVALFQYTLDDPQDHDAFSQYLDTPEFINAKNQALTPAQMAEQLMLQLAQDVSTKYGSRLVARPQVTRGSLELTLELIGNTWTFLKDYHDVIESVMVIGTQIAFVTNMVTRTYEQRHKRTVAVSGGLKVSPEPRQRDDKSNNNIGSQGTSLNPPINLTNSYTPPQSNPNVNVSLNASGLKNGSSGCVNTCLFTLVLVTLVTASFLYLFVDYESRLIILDNVANGISELLKIAGNWLLSLADILEQ